MKIRLQNVRVAFAHGLFTASALEENQTPKYGADFLLAPGSSVVELVKNEEGITQAIPTTMEKVMLKVADETWKGKGAAMLKTLEPSKKCYRDGDARVTKGGDPYESHAGVWYVSAKNKIRPTIINRDRSPIEEKDGIIYSGCNVNATIEVYGMSDPKKKGVHAALKGVQFVKDNDAFGGGTPGSADDFDSIEDGADAEALV